MINITIIGKMGSGKTTFIKTYIQNRRCFIFDVQNEYKLTTDNRKQQSRMIDLNHNTFLSESLDKKNTVCVFEDATGFVEGRLSADLRKTLVSKRHTRNTNILVFHSISSVPPRVLQLSDYIILFNTSDELYQIENKFPSMVKHFNLVKNNVVKNPFFYKIVKVQ